jgi:hypothetical protein
MGLTRNRRTQEETRKSYIWGAGCGENWGKNEGVIEKTTTKKEVKVRRTKGTGTKNEWWYKECEQSKKEEVKVLREWRRNKIDRNRFLEVKRRYREREM